VNTNDLISLIIKNHCNADSLAQIASAVECLQEQLADMAAAKELMEQHTHVVKIFCKGGIIERIRCASMEEAQVARKERVAKGGVNCAIVGTCEQIAELDMMFND